MNGNDILIPSLIPLQDLPRYHVQDTHVVGIQDQESHLCAEFGLVLGRAEDSKAGGGHESSLDLCEGHDRFVDVQG